MYYFSYLLGSFYIIRSIFRFSNYASQSLVENQWIEMPVSRIEKLDECIYSSLHAVLTTLLSSLSLTSPIFMNPYHPFDLTLYDKPINNQMQLFTTCFSLSYFILDLCKCIYHKKYVFILHHLASIHLLTNGLQSFGEDNHHGFYIMNMLFLLESNTVLLNVGYILKECKFHYSITCLSWIVHLMLFIIFRLITVPKLILVYYMYEGITMRTILEIPSFMFILGGSMYWSYRQILGIQKYLKESSVL
jgi:hypothetical protein